MKKKLSKRSLLNLNIRLNKAFLKREQNYGELNYKRQTKSFKSLLESIKCEDLRKEIIKCSHYFERVIEFKDMAISLLLDAIYQDEQLHIDASAEFHRALEKLINFFFADSLMLYRDMSDEVDALMLKCMEAFNELRQKCQEEQEYLSTMTYQIEVINKFIKNENDAKNFAIINENSQHHQELLNDIILILTARSEKVQEEMKKLKNKYFQTVEEKRKENLITLEYNRILERDVKSNLKKITKLEIIARECFKRLKHIDNRYEQRLRDSKSDKKKLHDYLFLFKKKLCVVNNIDFSKHKVIIVSSNEIYKILEEKMSKGTKLIHVLKACRRFETLENKLMPYPITDIDVPDKSFNNFIQKISLFKQKIAEIQTTRYALNEERVYLKKENLKLREEIHKFCECLDCPSLQPDKPEKKRAGMIPYTDAGEMIRKQNKQLCFLNTQTASLDDYD